MGHSRLRPFICVGLAYFVIAVAVPFLLMKATTEPGHWTSKGIFWSSLGGAAGAVGALGIIIAFNNNGKPSYVMPLVFGGAPVVNALLTIYWERSWASVSSWFLAGLILVAMGAVLVLVFKPKPPQAAHRPVPVQTVVESPPGGSMS
jgi:uncharacterized membrane protein